jgi:hypothetical protein
MTHLENSGVFEGRETFLTFRDYLPGATQSWISVQRQASEMARTQKSKLTNIVNLPHIGWTNRSYHQNIGDVVWLGAAQTGTLVTDPSTPVPHLGTFEAFAQQPISGVVYNGSVAATGGNMNVIRPPAGTNWSTNNLAGDQAAFLAPNTDEDYTQMLRVMKTTTYNDPGSPAPWDNLLFNLWAPSSAITPRSTLGTFYFNGPAGDPYYFGDKIPPVTLPGTGQYALKVRGDGYAYLYELCTGSPFGSELNYWAQRFAFLWNTNQRSVSWTMIHICVQKKMWKDANGKWLGDTLSFGQGSSGVAPGQFSPVQNMAELAIMELRFQKGLVPTYRVPRQTNQPMKICPVRMDIAIDCRCAFNAAKHVYTTPAVLRDDLVNFEQPATQSRDLNFVWSGVLPTGCTWSAKLYDQNGVALTQTTATATQTTAQGQTGYANYRPTAGMTGFYPEITLNASVDTFSAPILAQWALYGGPLYDAHNPTTPFTVPRRETGKALPEQVIESVTMHPQTSDPGGENATVIVWDLTGELDFLETVNFLPAYLYTTDPNPDTNPSGGDVSLIRGYALNPSGERMRWWRPGQEYPGIMGTRWTIHIVGEWARLADATLPVRQIWQDETTGLNSKVTDVVRNMIQSAYPPSYVSVPDSGIRLFGTSPETWTQEPGTRVADLCIDWMRDYFGGWCLFDVAAGTKGVFRGFLQKTAPYNNLAIFEMDHPTTIAGDNIPRIPQWAAAYPTTIIDSQKVQSTFMQGGTFNPRLERAEGNCVIIRGGGVNKDASLAAGTDAAMFSQFAINVKSVNFLNLNPGDPGYPDGTDSAFFNHIIPIRQTLNYLPNQNAVDWWCRRIFDRSCYARYYLAFVAPMIDVIDVTDPLQVRPRMLRYYDPVLVRQYDGSLKQFLVVGCSPTYVKDRVQMAHYLLVTQENINERAVIPDMASELMSLAVAQVRLQGVDMRKNSGVSSSQKQGMHINSEVMALPTLSNFPIQDLNNTSPTFGKFYFMNGYSSIGGGDPIGP